MNATVFVTVTYNKSTFPRKIFCIHSTSTKEPTRELRFPETIKYLYIKLKTIQLHDTH